MSKPILTQAEIKYFSMFSGVGGFELALQDIGECVGYSEIDKDAIDIYEKHFEHTNYGDATNINAAELPDFDLLVGGFPCQAFSISGSRKGFDDTRGTLFFDIARIVKEKRPRNILLENVPGLLSHDNGRTIKIILSALEELDYDTETMVLDGFYFGSGTRKRVFIHATHRDNQTDAGEGIEQTISVYPSSIKGLGDKGYYEPQVSRSSARIIRTFAKLPDWLDSWETIYS